MLSYSFWQREYGAQTSAIGRQILLDGKPFEIVGVAQDGFFGVEVGKAFEVAIPVCAELLINGEDAHTPKRHHWWLAVTGRLKPGWNLAQARAHLRAISPGLFEATIPPKLHAGERKKLPRTETDRESRRDRACRTCEKTTRTLYLILLGIAALVLVIACANLANLMLARASARERELAVRLAIGASRLRLIRQMLAESLLLAPIGAAMRSSSRAVTQQLSGPFSDYDRQPALRRSRHGLANFRLHRRPGHPHLSALWIDARHPSHSRESRHTDESQWTRPYRCPRALRPASHFSRRASRALVGTAGRRAVVRSQPA